MQVVLIIIILIIIFAIIILCASNKQQITNFLISTNPMYYQGSLYWMDLILGNQTFRVLLDTGSNLVIIAGDTCNTCQSGATLPVNKNDPGDLTASYGGGQQIRYNNESMYAPQFGKNINVSVISSGTNPQGTVNNILGLLDPDLGLKTLVLDFPNMNILFNAPLRNSGISTPLVKSSYLAFQINGYQDVNMIVLDTGANYVLTSDLQFPQGFNFMVGNTQISVPPDLIRSGQNIAAGSVVIGNLLLSKYRWEIDFTNSKIWVYNN